jgi:hypothetical protein
VRRRRWKMSGEVREEGEEKEQEKTGIDEGDEVR